MKKLTTGLLWFMLLSLTIGSAGATVPTTIARNDYVGNGATTVYPYTFRILESGNIQVTVNGVVQTLTTHYTVSGVGATAGGNVTFVAAPGNALPIIFSRRIPITQLTDYVQNAPLQAETLERNLDKLTMIAQMLQEFVFDPDFVPSPPSGSIPASIIDVKGDLIVGTANDTTARLAAGATGQVLKVDPSAGAGLKWMTEALNIRNFGADPAASAATNRAAIQSALDAVPAGGGALLVPCGTYPVDGTPMTVTKKVTVAGEGPCSVIATNHATATIFAVTLAVDAVVFRDFVITASVTRSAGDFLTVAGSGGSANAHSLFENMRFTACFRCIHFQSAAYWKIVHSMFLAPVSEAVRIENTINIDEGDSVIANSLFSSLVTTGTHINYISSSGLKVVGNKFLQGGVQLGISNPAATNIGLVVITGNSFEDFGTHGIAVAPGAGSTWARIVISGNEFLGIGSTWSTNIDFETGAAQAAIVGNVFDCRSSSAGTRHCIALNGTTSQIVIGNNLLFGTITAGNLNGITVASTGSPIHVSHNTFSGTFTNQIVPGSGTVVRDMNSRTIGQITGAVPANGSMFYCSDCTIANPCTGGGTGAIYKRLNGVNVCN